MAILVAKNSFTMIYYACPSFVSVCVFVCVCEYDEYNFSMFLKMIHKRNSSKFEKHFEPKLAILVAKNSFTMIYYACPSFVSVCVFVCVCEYDEYNFSVLCNCMCVCVYVRNSKLYSHQILK